MPNASAALPNISKSFKSNQSVPNGSLVSLVSSSNGYIQLANLSNAQNLVGVSTASNNSLLAVNPSSNSVQVATSGSVNVLVSDVNGKINPGDDIAVSPFNGVGMKSSNGDRIIGAALTSFNQSTSGVSSEVAQDSSGKAHTLTIGFVRINISVGIMNKNSSSFSIESIQQYVEGVTGRQVSLTRILIGLSVAIVGLIAIVTLTYASIYGGIVSIGRNPLAKFSVFRTMTSVMGMVMFIAVVASVTVYVLLY